jgi:hypothetical protein
MKNVILFVLWLMLATVSYADGGTAVNKSGNSIVAVGKNEIIGQYTSLTLDGQNNPVISFYDATNEKLKVLHCAENNCSQFKEMTAPDPANNIGKYSSLTLDQHGNPIISYYDQANTALKVLHCGNPSCSANNIISTPDATGNVGEYTAIVANRNGEPTVSYYDATKGVLKILHCGNAQCNNGNIIVTPDLTSSNGVQSSIQLNAAGNPVIAYFDFTNSALKVLTCGNSDCSAHNRIVTVESIEDVGRYPSLVLDKKGNPAVSYLDLSNGKLKILRCDNATCTGKNSIVAVGASGVVGYYSSLKINANDIPVVSYYDKTNGDLNVLRCGNANCTGGNTISAPDTKGQVGLYTSMVLDSKDNPVISYYDASNGILKILHCDNPSCNPAVKTDGYS